MTRTHRSCTEMLLIFTLISHIICFYQRKLQTPILVASFNDGETVFGTKVSKDSSGFCRQITPITPTQPHRLLSATKSLVIKSPAVREESQMERGTILDIIATTKDAIIEAIIAECQLTEWFQESFGILDSDLSEGTVVVPIITSGDPKNRIDVVFMGDGIFAI
jgi:hypothetical protein